MNTSGNEIISFPKILGKRQHKWPREFKTEFDIFSMLLTSPITKSICLRQYTTVSNSEKIKQQFYLPVRCSKISPPRISVQSLRVCTDVILLTTVAGQPREKERAKKN